MTLRALNQRGWLKGLNASISYASQPKGTLARVSNLLYTQRGALQSCDQNLGISSYLQLGPQTGMGAFLELILFTPPGIGQAYGVNSQLLSLLQNGDNLSLVLHNASVVVYGYNLAGDVIYNFTSATIAAANPCGVPASSSPLPQMLQFANSGPAPWQPSTAYLLNQQVQPNPANGFIYTATTAGTSGSSQPTWPVVLLGTVHDGSVVWTATATLATEVIIIALGNQITPYLTDGTAANTVPLSNTFTGAFPNWLANTAYSAGDIISPAVNNGFIYICTQGGVSGGSTPTFPSGPGQTVQDANVIWQQDGSSATIPPRGAAHVFSHAGSLWLWNTHPTDTSDGLDGPACLKMSDTNNPNSWNPLNTAFVGRGDGQQGMGMADFTIAEAGISPTGSLVLFKEFSTYQVTGIFGASDFSIQLAQTDMGCIAPRSIQFVPGFGIARLTHLGVAVFDGVRDTVISEEIRPYLFGGRPMTESGASDITPMNQNYSYFAKGSLVSNPPMYVLAIPTGSTAALNRLLCYDLVLKTWSIVDLPMSLGVLKTVPVLGLTNPVTPTGTQPTGAPLTLFGGFSDGMISRWQAGDYMGWQGYVSHALIGDLYHTGTPLTFSFRGASFLGTGTSDRLFFRRAILRGRRWNSALAQSYALTMYATVDGVQVAKPARLIVTPGPIAGPTWELVQDIGLNGLDGYVTVGGTIPLNQVPIEIDGLDAIIVQRPVGSLARIG